MMSGRIAYQVQIIRPDGRESFDLFRTQEGAEEFVSDVLGYFEGRPISELPKIEVTGPFEV